MPTSLHPQAKFDPIPPDFDVHDVVDQTPNFKWVQRVSRGQIRSLGQQEFEKLVQIHVVAGGKPLVIDGWDALLPEWLFNADWLEQNFDKKQENVRDIPTGSDIPMTTGHYLRSMKQLTDQWTTQNFRDERRQRLYLKDIDCPTEWQDVLKKLLYPNLFYLNENVTTTGISEASQQMTDEKSTEDKHPNGVSSAPAGDLMSSLPEEMRAENLMCYIGHEGTYTPAHREMCASVGHNIMVEASGKKRGEKPGSSIWFMTESKDRDVVREYFLSMLGHDIEIEKHFAQVNAWKKAPFDVYLVEQRAGDFIIVPPLAAHQVWNRGTRTMKVAWNRTTPETLRLALHEALPKARLVCRDEQYKNKAMVYFTLEKYYRLLKEMEKQDEIAQNSFLGIGQDIMRKSPRAKQLSGDFKTLFGLFTEILIDEAFATKESQVEFLPFDSCVTCSYCRCNIFNRFLTCKHCTRTLANGDEDAYDVCMECYAMGRSCACLSGLKWCEQWSWSALTEKYEAWRAMVIVNDGFVDLGSSPAPFEVARQKWGKKAVTQICQEALIRRPWKDITKEEYAKGPSDTDQADADDKPKIKNKRKQKQGEVRRCHVCCHKDYSYRVHQCTNSDCAEGYCYGVLYRAFDMMPQSVLQDESWQCPKCLGICNCGYCRRSGNTNPYTPKNTSLGHDTRPIADDRSIEALVDFRIHNLSWLKAAGEESRSKDSRRMQRLREKANTAKEQNTSNGVDADNGAEADPSSDPTAARGTVDQVSATTSPGPNDQEDVITMGEEAHDADDFPTLAPTGDAPGKSIATNQPGMGVSGPFAFTNATASPYPDPSVLSNYGIGMGYYEQDDTPDRILFDHYQAPPLGTVRLADLEIPESVKNSIRTAKKKTKRENEDPDFIGGRSHKRQRQFNSADLLNSMDPALFDAESSAVTQTTRLERHKRCITGVSLSETNPADTDVVLAEASAETQNPSRGSNLRYAKPLASYVEVGDVDMEEPEETDGERGLHGTAAEEEAADLDVQSQLLKEKDEIGDIASKREPPTRRRGRKPTRVNGRGRPFMRQSQRVSRSHELETERESTAEAAAASTVEMTRVNTPAVTKRGRGRPRKIASNLITSSTAAVDAASSRTEEAIPTKNESKSSKPSDSKPKEGSRRYSEKKASVLPQFMSMAERMALKGKKFRIGSRKTTTSGATERDDGKESNATQRSGSPVKGISKLSSAHLSRLSSPNSEILSVPEVQGMNLNHKTVVRLGEVDSSEDDDQGSEASDQMPYSESSDDSDDGDIPASGRPIPQKSSSMLRGVTHQRGRGRGRGSGGVRGGARGVANGRGRGRGRPRGRPRGQHS